jgi:hypothetical protein
MSLLVAGLKPCILNSPTSTQRQRKALTLSDRSIIVLHFVSLDMPAFKQASLSRSDASVTERRECHASWKLNKSCGTIKFPRCEPHWQQSWIYESLLVWWSDITSLSNSSEDVWSGMYPLVASGVHSSHARRDPS